MPSDLVEEGEGLSIAVILDKIKLGNYLGSVVQEYTNITKSTTNVLIYENIAYREHKGLIYPQNTHSRYYAPLLLS